MRVPDAPDPRIRAVPDSEPLDEREGDIFGQASGGGLGEVSGDLELGRIFAED
jgi:hypothetical protein